MLEVINLSAGYGSIEAVRSLSFKANNGEIVALLGPNGAGKSSTLMCLLGLVEQTGGAIFLKGEDISKLPVEKRVLKGISIAPEGRRIFADMSVHENLVLGGHVNTNEDLDIAIQEVYSYFPKLRERSKQIAGSLSGGEQQMLSIGRALISSPDLLIVDELSLGLMPKVVDECYEVIKTLKERGICILLVEQNSEKILNIADNIVILDTGNVVWQGPAKVAKEDEFLVERLMGIH